MIIVAFAGPLHSGKSSCAKYLVKKYDFKIASFAYILKQMLITFLRLQGVSFELADRMVYGDLKETPSEYLGGKSPRVAMQGLGTEWGRELIHPDIWVNAWENSIRNFARVTNDDTRHPNEIEKQQSKGGIVLYIKRPNYTPEVQSEEKTLQHSSETYDLEPLCDSTIINDGTLEDLYNKVELELMVRQIYINQHRDNT